jgi:hypothetical protein
MRRLISAGQISGHAVEDSKRVKIGTIEDLLIDKQSGRVVYAILNFGGFLGIGEKRVALPWPAFGYNREEDALVLNLDRDVLARAPNFDFDSLPDMEDLNWHRELHVYFGLTPYWDQEMVRRV